MTTEFRKHWTLDPEIDFLNHGSFGACPRPVLERQSELRARMEREPVLFLHRELEPLIDEAREALASFVGTAPEDLVFVPNATSGVNTVLRSLTLQPGDELVVTDQEYNASRNALDYAAEQTGARVVSVPVPFPIESADRVVEAVLGAVTDRTRLVLIDHITSQTGLILPIEPIISTLNERGVETLIDGAHAPGMLPLDLSQLGATYYTGNCHKWICAPKGAAFLRVDRARQADIRPLAISHGANSPRGDRSRFQIEGDWLGTSDPTPWLCVPTAVQFMDGLLPGGWPALREHNRNLVLESRDLICRALGSDSPAPADMIGSLASIPLQDGTPGSLHGPMYLDPLHVELFDRHRIEVPVMPWPAPPKRLLRISAQIYNDLAQYQRLVDALPAAERAQ